MGSTIYKKTLDCTCGCDYGSNCGKRLSFLFRYNRSCDIGTLWIGEAKKGESEFTYTHVTSMQDDAIAALVQVLTSDMQIEKLTESELKLW